MIKAIPFSVHFYVLHCSLTNENPLKLHYTEYHIRQRQSANKEIFRVIVIEINTSTSLVKVF